MLLPISLGVFALLLGLHYSSWVDTKYLSIIRAAFLVRFLFLFFLFFFLADSKAGSIESLNCINSATGVSYYAYKY